MLSVPSPSALRSPRQVLGGRSPSQHWQRWGPPAPGEADRIVFPGGSQGQACSPLSPGTVSI